jgi:hypothetical protein
MRNKTISFIPDSERAEKLFDSPIPASKVVPNWYKKLNKYVFPDVKFTRFPGKNTGPDDTNLTAKACAPFLDTFTTGYMVVLPTDVAVVDPNIYEARMIWDSHTNMVDAHASSQLGDLNVPEEFEPGAYKWNFHWSIRVPKGYSLLYTHPLNRPDLPFQTFSGIVDSDEYSVPVNLPFLLRKNFIGTIEKGTPVAQVIPIKRESWNHKKLTHDKYNPLDAERLKLYLGGAYKKLFWTPKRYK